MSDDKNQSPKPGKVDEELADLLDSALQDFSTSKSDDKKTEKPEKADDSLDNNVAEWSEDFIQQAASEFEANFASMLAAPGGNRNGAEITPEFLQEKLQQMTDAAQQVMSTPSTEPSTTDFATTISQAIQGLNQGTEGLQAPPFSEDDFMRLFTGQSEGGNNLVPFMQSMMHGLLSKEVLGPSLQDFVERLPGFIEANRATLDPADVERYEKQKTLMEEVLGELNKEQEADSAEVKSERFSKVLALMQKLQDYGQPPRELVGDVDTPFNFDPLGNPSSANNADCSIM